MNERKQAEAVARAVLSKHLEPEVLAAKVKEIVDGVLGPEQSVGFRFGRLIYKVWKYLATLMSMTMAVVLLGAWVAIIVEFFNFGYNFFREVLPW